ncbi:hypothetical protein QQF64_005114 [Cirrhinus molitorella]
MELEPAVSVTPTDSPDCDHQRPTAARNHGASALSRPACYPPRPPPPGHLSALANTLSPAFDQPRLRLLPRSGLGNGASRCCCEGGWDGPHLVIWTSRLDVPLTLRFN